MLPQINRIKKKKDFERIFKNSKSLKSTTQGAPLIFKITKNSLGLNRFGFVVSQKVSKKATVRNKIRRRLSEAVKAEIENIKIGTDVVIIALPGAEKKDFLEIKGTVKDTLVKAKIIVGNKDYLTR